MIKKIHFVWISRQNKPIPEKCLQFVDMWKAMYYDWEVRIWGNDDIAGLNDPVLDACWKDPNIQEAQVCNRMRMSIIYNFGGIYADIDTKPIKRIDELIINSKHDMVIGYTQARTKTKGYTVDTNMFYASSGNNVLRTVMDKFPVAQIGNRDINEYIANECSNDVTLLPWRYFQDYNLTQETYTLHWPYRLATWVQRAR